MIVFLFNEERLSVVCSMHANMTAVGDSGEITGVCYQSLNMQLLHREFTGGLLTVHSVRIMP